MRILRHNDIDALLTPAMAVASLRRALDEQSRGAVQMPPRQTTDAGKDRGGLDKHSGNNWLRISTAFLNEQGYMGFKAMNRAAGLGMRYLLGLYHIESGELVAFMDANPITTGRTAATSALGTHLLARPDARRIALLGSGVQARALLRALADLRTIDSVNVFSPTEASRTAFAAEMSSELDIEVAPSSTAEQAVATADIVLIALRATKSPVLSATWLRPGMHVTGLSSVRHDAREIDDDVWRACDLVVVDDVGTVGQSGDALSVSATGFKIEALPELWMAHAGAVGRETESQLTMFKSAGNAMQDITLAAALLEAADSLGPAPVGVDLGQFPEVKPYA